MSYVSIFTHTWSRFQVENRILDSLLSYGLILCIKDRKWSLLSSSPFPVLSLLYEHSALSYLPSHLKFPNLSQMALCPSGHRASEQNIYFDMTMKDINFKHFLLHNCLNLNQNLTVCNSPIEQVAVVFLRSKLILKMNDSFFNQSRSCLYAG